MNNETKQAMATRHDNISNLSDELISFMVTVKNHSALITKEGYGTTEFEAAGIAKTFDTAKGAFSLVLKLLKEQMKDSRNSRN